MIAVLIALIGLFIRWIPVVTEYPIGGDAGQYYSQLAHYAETWPFAPTIMQYSGGLPSNADTLPILPWFMATFNRVFGMDLFLITQITPLIVVGLTTLVVYGLGVTVSGRKSVGLFASFLYTTSEFNLWIVYPAYNLRVEFGVLFISLFLLLVLRTVNQESQSQKRSLQFFGGLSLFFAIASHDYAMFAAAVIYGSLFFASLILVDRKTLDRVLSSLLQAGVIGFVLSLPILFFWEPFLLDRYFIVGARATLEGSSERELVGRAFLNGLPAFPLGYIVSLFGFMGAINILLSFWVKRNRTVGNLAIIVWLGSMFALANLYRLDIHVLDIARMMSYLVVPISVAAGLGIVEFLNWFQRYSNEFTILNGGKLIVPVVVGLLMVVQVYDSMMVADRSSSERPARAYLTADIVDAMIWLRDNSDEASIVFVPVLAPYVAGEYTAGFTGRATIFSIHPNVPFSDSKEYAMTLDAQRVLSLQDPAKSFEILNRYADEYIEGFAFIGKKNLRWANEHGANIHYHLLDSHYERVFENREIVIYRAYRVID